MTRYVVDIETTSECDLTACGAWVYAEHPSTRLLCIAWCDADRDDEPQIWDCLTGTDYGYAVMRNTLLNAELLIAHNANFERHCLRNLVHEHFGEAGRWACSAMLSGSLGRPRSLKDACKLLLFPANKQKDARGVRLLGTFSYKTPKGRIYAPSEKPEDFRELCEYCKQDVVAERALWRALEPFGDDYMRGQWLLDCDIEDRGVPIDRREVEGARALYLRMQGDAEKRCAELTGGISMRSTPAMRKWTAEHGWPLDSFSASAVDEALANTYMCEQCPEVAEMLCLRKAAAGTAGKKYDAILSMLAHDGCCHGILVGRGAHTGRYVGKGLQPQNLPRGSLDKAYMGAVREIAHRAADGDISAAEEDLTFWTGDGANGALGSLLRDCIAPLHDDECLVVSDYSAIEARVLAWLAGETWVEDIFRGDGKIYERTAAAMYGKDVESITKHERMAGKIATLALGYGGGTGALQAFAAGYGVTFDDASAESIVQSWRKSRPRTVELWRALYEMLNAAMRTDAMVRCRGNAKVWAKSERIAGRKVVRVYLPSSNACGVKKGRALTYWEPVVEQVNGKPEVCVETYGCDGDSRIAAAAEGAAYSRIWGGKLCENIVQAIAFDLLLGSLRAMHQARIRVIFHVHDEIVAVTKKCDAEVTAKTIARIMTYTPDWANGLPLATEPLIAPRYCK